MSIKNYEGFKKIQEVRTKKKCPVLNFKPIRESETYTDMIGMGWIEVLADNPAGILAKATEEERNFKDRLGNIAFYHPIFEGSRLTSRSSRSAGIGYPHFNIKHDGAVRVVEGPNLTAEFPRLNSDLTRACMTIEDYLYKMSFLLKYAIKESGFPISDGELYSDESYKDLMQRKIEADPSVVKHFKDITATEETGGVSSSNFGSANKVNKIISLPPSLKQTDLGRGTAMLKRFGVFDDDDDDN
jgi:hypothetical protein